ncbi:ribosomal protein L13 [Rhizoclosmatium globosum]|uniref:Ribosomal protein L13 n=1 Tax=Rhizoclosmatium globosum TaxID=329046 RepID=A0A1Y2CYG9_9FUNG|nr:54S ribosomal protein L23, mitochondrial [Rhizoclosmatium hyalinum]KAJ3285147.1 54S ribosomal protein L23, mitochondrial [Rhizoclosmatium sp. JEL0117]ORY51894.1 ribosomal protein L13 [Rhizoclosmatium globosum]|eukprot:ORY51894.1 ribosomal protein L13 [Rhizoclosmatium globosum]
MNTATSIRGRVWHLVDARDRTLGTLAQRISIALRGKYKPTWHPSDDVGDYVVVINARHLKLTGKKDSDKQYFWHSRWIGGLTQISHDDFKAEHPNGPLKKAIYGMLPKNNLRRVHFDRLRVFADADHPYSQNIMRDYEKEAIAASIEAAAASEASGKK